MAAVSRCLRAAALLLVGVAAPLSAHPLPETRGWIDVVPGGMHLLLHIPLNRLEFGVGYALADHPSTLIARDGPALARYLLQHIGARSDNVGWQVLTPKLSVVGDDRRAELVADVMLRAPVGVNARRFTLLYDAVTHEVRTHRVEMLLRNDWSAGRAAQVPTLLGELQYATRTLDVDLPSTRPGGAWGSLARGGATHIAEGTDHLLFVLLLLLVAPLTCRANRWRDARDLRAALRAIATVASAFTVGHSITLALGSTGVLVPPAALVEVAVACTIGIAGIHAIRPLFPRAEVAMALGFGLIHGFAFSASLDGGGLTAWQHAQALLAFNGGIELMQLVLIAVVLPPLVLVLRASPRGYGYLRIALASLGVVQAGRWGVEQVQFMNTGAATMPTAGTTVAAEWR